MPRVHKQEYWAFIDLVAPSEQLPQGKEQWSSSDATLAYCHKCKATFEYKSGTSANVRKHLRQAHPNVILKTHGSMELSEASKMVNEALASKRKSGASFLSPSKRAKRVTPAQEEMATRLLIDWICKCLRPLGVTEDKELRFS
ncbi:hypothetical protein PF007_g4414 [Phytophthora fragariae]|uniref:BED-type domain-containing protein n=1 Tax=Phytophthora fragariae TaxID=53985 RepID=A0A6A3U9J2_9STRA|nr:hypothetical protein PF007_g4414 [Phytophthora fragariae]KAE9148032.1 hypothetical protein PF006_g7338 [Phytophthora fragariae]KAE9314273.1 hypothetical protein PF001_g8343 [Phytophthora fragariae]